MKGTGKRLKILSEKEIEGLYGLPEFTLTEKEKFFALDPLERNELKSLRKSSPKILFVLLLGYFKAKKLFFTFTTDEVRNDFNYIVQKYFPDVGIGVDIDLGIAQSTRLSHQSRILKLLNYHDCDRAAKNLLRSTVRATCRSSASLRSAVLTYHGNSALMLRFAVSLRSTAPLSWSLFHFVQLCTSARRFALSFLQTLPHSDALAVS